MAYGTYGSNPVPDEWSASIEDDPIVKVTFGNRKRQAYRQRIGNDILLFRNILMIKISSTTIKKKNLPMIEMVMICVLT